MDDAALTPGAHRPVRRLDGKDTALAGELVTDGERLRVRVPAEDVPEALWMFGAAEHVAGVRDIIRRRDGQDALLPWCTDAVDAFLGRRAAAEQPLAPGEVVTLVGSVLRGTLELAGAEVRGRWWLADDGRPLFVPGEGATAAASAAEVIARIQDGCTDRMLERVLTGIRAGIEDHRIVARSIERWERELTELAAPRALQQDVPAPERVEQIPVRRTRMPLEVAHVREQGGPVDRLRRGIGALAEGIRMRGPLSLPPLSLRLPAALRRRRGPAASARPEPSAVGRSPKRASGGRGRMLLVGAAVAGVVLVGGMLWPDDSGDPSSATEPAPARARTGTPRTPGASTPPATPAPPTPEPDAVAGGSMEQRVRDLLATVLSCSADGDDRCERAVAPGAAEAVLRRLVPAGAERAVTPVEDYGDVAVVRLGPAQDQGEQMLVLVRQKAGWLVRDVYDVADQPSGK